MKILFFLLLALLSFALTVAGMLAYTGNLNKEGLDKILGRTEPAIASEPELEPDELSETTRALQEREEALATREQNLERQQQRLTETQDQMEELRGTLEDLIAQLTQTADTMDANEMTRLQEVAKSLGSMKEDQAAMVLEEWPAEQGAQLLQLIEERTRGKILDKMNERKAAEFLSAMAELNASMPATP
jgi:flagellar motility protein MotE (MotC chaperone)